MNQIQKAAELLWQSSISKKVIPPVREILTATNIEDAYQVQQINVQKRIANGEITVGKKIGLTSFAVQEQLGVDQPDFGILFNTTEVADNGTLSYEELMQPKAEAEIAFVMAKDLDEYITLEKLVDAIDYACASIEIVGSRVENWNIRITDTIADNASASHFVMGKTQVKLDQIDLINCKMEMTKNGKVASTGVGKACMDNPLNAALWLAKVMAERGTPLKAGEILLSGALGTMVVIEKGDKFTAEIEGLGSVSLKID